MLKQGQMIGKIVHVGLTVSNLENSIDFYKNMLGLSFQGQMIMEGIETERLFGIKNCVVKVAYLKSQEDLSAPPVELIQFIDNGAQKVNADLHKTSISELCFNVSDIESVYSRLKENGVEFISEPQFFNLSSQGFGKSKSVYFKDPDGIILELLESISD